MVAPSSPVHLVLIGQPVVVLDPFTSAAPTPTPTPNADTDADSHVEPDTHANANPDANPNGQPAQHQYLAT
jgi:hypothetical protein